MREEGEVQEDADWMDLTDRENRSFRVSSPFLQLLFLFLVMTKFGANLWFIVLLLNFTACLDDFTAAWLCVYTRRHWIISFAIGFLSYMPYFTLGLTAFTFAVGWARDNHPTDLSRISTPTHIRPSRRMCCCLWSEDREGRGIYIWTFWLSCRWTFNSFFLLFHASERVGVDGVSQIYRSDFDTIFQDKILECWVCLLDIKVAETWARRSPVPWVADDSIWWLTTGNAIDQVWHLWVLNSRLLFETRIFETASDDGISATLNFLLPIWCQSLISLAYGLNWGSRHFWSLVYIQFWDCKLPCFTIRLWH